MHVQLPGSGGDIAVVVVQHPLNVFPFQPVDAQRSGAERDGRIAAIDHKRRQNLISISGLGQGVDRAKLDRRDPRSNADVAGHDRATDWFNTPAAAETGALGDCQRSGPNC